MAPQYVRYIVEEVLENRIGFYPTYGNTLMGLAASVPLAAEDNFPSPIMLPNRAPSCASSIRTTPRNWWSTANGAAWN
jgi:hypothetical protein